MSEFLKQLSGYNNLLGCIPFLIIKHKEDGGIQLSLVEIVKTLLTAGIIALVVGYGTVRVMGAEVDRIIVRLDKIEVKLDSVDDMAKMTASERRMRRLEIDRRLDMLERKK